MTKKRILTGDRPTGKPHLGHWVGSFQNRVKLQDDYEMFVIIADLHVLTTRTNLEQLAQTKDHIREMLLGYLSVGLDPKKVTFYVQSHIPEVTELFTIFSNLVTVPRAQRIPTLKDVMRDLQITEPSVGLLSYPILQAADILMVNANLVPVGKDQESHLELTREIARTFNRLYGDTLNEPEALIGDVPSLPGTDGQAKMSKSIGNVINLSDDSVTVEKQVMGMYTDPTRLRPTDPGHVEGNPVFMYHDIFNADREEVTELKDRYTKGQVGDVEVKQKLVQALNEFLDPIRERRQQFEKDPDMLNEILIEGTKKARTEAQKILELVRLAMKLSYF